METHLGIVFRITIWPWVRYWFIYNSSANSSSALLTAFKNWGGKKDLRYVTLTTLSSWRTPNLLLQNKFPICPSFVHPIQEVQSAKPITSAALTTQHHTLSSAMFIKAKQVNESKSCCSKTLWGIGMVPLNKRLRNTHETFFYMKLELIRPLILHIWTHKKPQA